MTYEDFILRLHRPDTMPRGTDAANILANARQAWRIDGSAIQVAR